MDLKTQAEIRRKKILANAEARLRKITGKPAEEDTAKEPVTDECKPHPTNGFISNGSSSRQETPLEEFDISKEPDLMNVQEELSVKESVLENTTATQRSAPTVQGRNTLKYDSYIFLLLGIIIRLLFYLGLSWLFLNNVLSPFLIACIPRLSAIFAKHSRPTGLVSLLTLMYSNQQRFLVPIKIFYTLRTISQLFALYFFSFTLADFVMSQRDS